MRNIALLWPLLAVFALSGGEISEIAQGKVVATITQNGPEHLANPAGMPWITYRGGDGSWTIARLAP